MILQRRMELALEAFDRASKVGVLDAESEKLWGEALLQTRHSDEAIDHLERAVQLAPGNVGARAKLGIALEMAGRAEEAIRAYEQVLSDDPTNSVASRLAALRSAAP